jgi:hypothetical protein
VFGPASETLQESGHLTSNIRSHVGYFDWTPPAQPFEKPAPYHRPDTGATLIAVSLLSLGLWAAIWGPSPHCSRLCCDGLSVRCLRGSVGAFSIKCPMGMPCATGLGLVRAAYRGYLAARISSHNPQRRECASRARQDGPSCSRATRSLPLPRLTQARAREGCTACGTGPMAGSPLKRPRKLGVRNEDDSVIAFHLTKPSGALAAAQRASIAASNRAGWSPEPHTSSAEIWLLTFSSLTRASVTAS